MLASAQSKLDFNGYISNMGQSSFAKDAQNNYQFLNDFILHNRINMAYYANDKFTAHVQFRNQFLWGQSIKNIP